MDNYEYLENETHFYIDENFTIGQPTQAFGWTWLPTIVWAGEELYSLFDTDGELIGLVHQKFKHVCCEAPYGWGDLVYSSADDLDEHGFASAGQRMRHFEKIAKALRGWLNEKRNSGVDLPLLRDSLVYQTESDHSDWAMTREEMEWFGSGVRLEGREGQVHEIDGWQAVPVRARCCEAYTLQDAAGGFRGYIQVRYGVVRAVAVAAACEALSRKRPQPDALIGGHSENMCRGEIVLREKTVPMANRFPETDRQGWIQSAVAAIRNTSGPMGGLGRR